MSIVNLKKYKLIRNIKVYIDRDILQVIDLDL